MNKYASEGKLMFSYKNSLGKNFFLLEAEANAF